MGSLLSMEHIHLHPLHSVIQRSFSINRHIDFFLWMQESVMEYLPHDVLVAAWGDFEMGKLKYDIASNVVGIRTEALAYHDHAMNQLMIKLHERWLINDCKWFVINNFNALDSEFVDKSSILSRFGDLKSILVYGVNDARTDDDTLYVFFNQSPTYHVKHSIMGMLMPHVDSALRKIECLSKHATLDKQAIKSPVTSAETSFGFSQREQEILHWIGTGKTNYEIGIILDISPNTVKNHVKRIFSKLGVTSRAQAIAQFNNKQLHQNR